MQLQQLGLFVERALHIRHRLVQQILAHVRTFETGFPEAIARTTQPVQIDIGRQRLTRHLDPVPAQLGIEIAACQQIALQGQLAGLVAPVVENLPDTWPERGDVGADHRIFRRRAVDHDPAAGHLHRLARTDLQHHIGYAICAPLDPAFDLRTVVAVGLQRLIHLGRHAPQQVGQAGLGQGLALFFRQLHQRQRQPHILQRLAGKALHLDPPQALATGQRGQDQQ